MPGVIQLAGRNSPVLKQGDVIVAHPARYIEQVHAGRIIDPKLLPTKSSGLRHDGATRAVLDAMRQFTVTRVGTDTLQIDETDLDGNLIDRRIRGDFLWLKHPGGETQIFADPIYADDPTPEFKAEVAAAIGVPVDWARYGARNPVGSQWKTLEIVSNGVSIPGVTISMERSRVRHYLPRRLAHRDGLGRATHRIFGEPGAEVWHGGRTDMSDAANVKAWDIIQNLTPHVLDGICPHCGREHRKFFAGRLDARSTLMVLVEDFTDQELAALVAPLEKRYAGKALAKGRDGSNLESRIDIARRYPGYDAARGKVVQVDSNGNETLVDIADMSPLPEDKLVANFRVGPDKVRIDDDTGEVYVTTGPRDIYSPFTTNGVLDDIRETVARVEDMTVPIDHYQAANTLPVDAAYVDPIIGPMDWRREKTQPVQANRGRLFSRRDNAPLPPKGGDREKTQPVQANRGRLFSRRDNAPLPPKGGDREKTQPVQVDRGRLFSRRDNAPLPPRGNERGGA